MLIVNGTLLTFGADHRIVHDGALRVKGDLITTVSTTAELRTEYPEEEELDAGGSLVMPGMICAHTHFYGLFARGMDLGQETPSEFSEVLQRLWWRLDKALSFDDIRYSTLVCLIDAIRNGTTTLVDHHASPNAVENSLDTIAEAVIQAGLRCCLCYEVSDRDGAGVAQAGLDENVRFITEARAGKNRQLAATFGLHASLTLSDRTLARAAEMAQRLDVGLHIHVAEGMADVEDSVEKYGLRVVERLAKHGILGPKTIAAHCVHVNADELDLLAETGTKVVHNPRSNMNNGVGVASIPKMLEQHIEVGLGNDGFSNDMFAEAKTAYLLHKLACQDPRVLGADEVLAMAIPNNALMTGLLFERPLGELAPGACADIVLLDYVPPTPLTVDNLPWHIIFGVTGAHVSTTIAGGKVLMHNRVLKTLDEERICARARELAANLWRRL
jgi:putative selenium metabolism protein SsnA